MTPARTVDEHAALVQRLVAPALADLAVETVPVTEARGRLTAAAVHSEVDLPLFRNSQMDGFAVRAADVASAPVALEVTGDIPAGHERPLVLTPGTALRIMTGAPVPDGADAIVPVEDTELILGRDDDLAGAVVEIARGRRAGEFVRDRGSDIRRGEVLVAEATLLAPRHLAALASAGIGSVAVRARPRVGILTTGTELVPMGAPAGFGKVFESNSVALAALVEESGAVVSSRTTSSDDPGEFERALLAATAVSDLIVTSGGISRGAYEVVREVLEPRGADVTSIAMQPGGPQATAVIDGVPIVCFPGNPVSTHVSFTVFVRGLLRQAAGLPALGTRTLPLASRVRSVAGKRQFARGRLLTDGTVEPLAGSSSHLVAGMAGADVLIEIPESVESLEAGADVAVWSL
jgi:molybdopterin molybdotransferase